MLTDNNLTVAALPVYRIPAYGQRTIVDIKEGYVVSPGYPGNYPKNSNGRLEITTSATGVSSAQKSVDWLTYHTHMHRTAGTEPVCVHHGIPESGGRWWPWLPQLPDDVISWWKFQTPVSRRCLLLDWYSETMRYLRICCLKFLNARNSRDEWVRQPHF